MSLRRCAFAGLVASAILASGASAAGRAQHASLMDGPGPRLQVSQARLADALSCPDHLKGRPTVLLVHGTSVTDEENWGWNYVRALPHFGYAVCTVLLPDRSLSDLQMTSEFVVYAIRAIH